MTAAALAAASAREVALYGTLAAAYDRAAELLDAGTDGVEALVAAVREADAVVAALRGVTALLGPERLAGHDVPAEVTACWREAAVLAGKAAQANARLVERAQAARGLFAARLAGLAVGRRALAGYRPVVAPRAATVERA